MCKIGLRQIDKPTECQKKFTIAVLQHQLVTGRYASVEQPTGSLLYSWPQWVEAFGSLGAPYYPWAYVQSDGCQLDHVYLGDDRKDVPIRKSQTWMSNFDLSLMELRCKRPRALVECTHDHAQIRGRTKVDGVSRSVAELSGAYTPVQATAYARCVRKVVEATKHRPAVLPAQRTTLLEMARTARGSRSFAEHRQAESTGMQVRAACGGASPDSIATVQDRNSGHERHQGSQGDMQVPEASSGTEPVRIAAHLGKIYPQYELRSGGVTVRFDNPDSQKTSPI